MRFRTAEQPQSPSPLLRLVALAFLPFYLCGLTLIAKSGTGSVFVASGMVAAWVGGLASVLAVFAVRFYRHGGAALRFRVSTIFLFMLLVGIYLAGFRWCLVSISPFSSFGQRPAETVFIVIGLGTFTLFNTALLLICMEALVSLALACQRLWKSIASARRIQAAGRDGK